MSATPTTVRSWCTCARRRAKATHLPRRRKDKYHGVVKFDVPTGKQHKAASNAPSYTKVFGESLVKEAEKDDRIVAITAAMPGGTGVDIFGKAFPDRTFDVGIAEQHGVTFAAGLATQGYKPFVAIYSTFLQRAYDQVVHDVAIQQLPVRFILDRAGLVGADGPTHAGSFDLAYLGCLPHFVIMAAADEAETRAHGRDRRHHRRPSVRVALSARRRRRRRNPGTTAALAMLNDAVKKGGTMATSSTGGLSGAFIPVSEDGAMARAAAEGNLSIEKLEAMTAVCSLGLDMIVVPGDIPRDALAGTIADVMAIGMINAKTTGARLIPAAGKQVGEWVTLGGLFGEGPVMKVSTAGNSAFVRRGGRIPAPFSSALTQLGPLSRLAAPLQSLTN